MDICVEINVNFIVRLILNKKTKKEETKGEKEINKSKNIQISSAYFVRNFNFSFYIYMILINVSCFKNE